MTKPAKFKYSMTSGTGYSLKMDGTLRNPEHAGVVSCALNGQLSDDAGLLRAAPALLAALKKSRERLANMAISGGGGADNKARGLEEIDAAIAAVEAGQ